MVFESLDIWGWLKDQDGDPLYHEFENLASGHDFLIRLEDDQAILYVKEWMTDPSYIRSGVLMTRDQFDQMSPEPPVRNHIDLPNDKIEQIKKSRSKIIKLTKGPYRHQFTEEYVSDALSVLDRNCDHLKDPSFSILSAYEVSKMMTQNQKPKTFFPSSSLERSGGESAIELAKKGQASESSGVIVHAKKSQKHFDKNHHKSSCPDPDDTISVIPSGAKWIRTSFSFIAGEYVVTRSSDKDPFWVFKLLKFINEGDPTDPKFEQDGDRAASDSWIAQDCHFVNSLNPFGKIRLSFEPSRKHRGKSLRAGRTPVTTLLDQQLHLSDFAPSSFKLTSSDCIQRSVHRYMCHPAGCALTTYSIPKEWISSKSESTRADEELFEIEEYDPAPIGLSDSD